MRVVAGIVTAVVIAAGCGAGTDEPSAESGISVVASFYPLAWASSEIGGDDVIVTDLTPAGVDAHDLELTPDQRDEIEDAALVVVMGNGFQPAVEEAAAQRDGPTLVVFDEFDSLDTAGRPVEDSHEDDEDEHADDLVDEDHADDVPTDEDDHDDEETPGTQADDDHSDDLDALDPHVWLDPVLMAEIVDVIADALADVAPDDASTFEGNAAALTSQLAELDTAFTTALEPCDANVIVTAHDAFGYLAARYGLETHGVAGIAPDAEPDPARLAALADLVEDEGVTVVFTEEYLSPAIAETLASEAGVETDVLHTLETLDDDAIASGDDYIDVMRTNLIRITNALGCPIEE